MKLEFEKNSRSIYESTETFRQEYAHIDSFMNIHMDYGDCERMLFLERRSIDRSNRWRSNWLGRLFRKKPMRYILLHNVKMPNDPHVEGRYHESSYFLTGAEIYPPFEDEEQNRIAVEGLAQALEAIDPKVQQPSTEE